MTKILIVDDDYVVLTTINKGLQRVGYTTMQASCGINALKVCNQTLPDLVLLDIRMPDISGIDVGKQLKKINIPFIFLSACDDKTTIEFAIEAGALGYLVKPLKINCIIPVIEVALVRAEEFAHADQTIDNLANALNKNREIDIAIGILMERHQISRVNAFEKLRSHARSSESKILDIAQLVVTDKTHSL